MLDKKGQVGETVTWIVATIVIIVVLGVSIFIASAKFNTDQTPDLQSISMVDTLASKSLFSYVLTNDSAGQIIYNQIKTEGNLNNLNGNLAQRIFNGFYKNEYSKIWLGTINSTSFTGNQNVYFGGEPDLTIQGNRVNTQLYYFIQDIELTPEKNLEMVLFPK